MTKKHNLTTPFDATPSWSGYSYQGCVAIYHVLRLLNDRSGHPNSSSYILELEWFEDFVIYSDQTTVLSLHQVKTTCDPSVSKLKVALWSLLAKTSRYNAKNAYLHTAHPMGASVNLADLLDNIPEEFETECQDLIHTGRFDDLIRNVSVYEYPKYKNFSSRSYCPIDEIHTLIEEELATYQQNNSLSFDCTKMRRHLLDMVNTHVMNRHYSRQRGQPIDPTIKFSDFIDVLEHPSNQSDDFYALCQLKEIVGKLCDEYIAWCESSGEDIQSELLDAMRAIHAMDVQDFLTFAQKTNPHVTVRENLARLNLHDVLSTQGTIGLLRALNTLCGLDLESFFYQKQGKFYCPTTLVSPSNPLEADMYKRTVAKKILQNRSNPDVLYQIHKFVASNLEIPLSDFLNMVVTEPTDYEARNHITKMAEKCVIPIEKAKQELGQ
jgi:hypothetical protein